MVLGGKSDSAWIAVAATGLAVTGGGASITGGLKKVADGTTVDTVVSLCWPMEL